MTQRSFEIALQKGEIGEQIVRDHLEKRGWVVYKPFTPGAHCFDILCIKDKKQAIALDVKAKSRLNKFPATGINQSHFEEYKAFSEKHSMPFWVVFVDEMQQTVYGNCISELEKPRNVDGNVYPFVMPANGRQVRLWPLVAMKTIAKLDHMEAEKLAFFNQRNYEFAAAS
jgi:hypothetical protein